MTSAARRIAWALLALPAVGQIYLLLTALLGRLSHPYDLEWMEGGMLVHALRISQGDGIYVEPSVDFIPYLYTPLYPGLLAALEPVFGLSYSVARGVSALSLVAAAALAVVALVRWTPRELRLAASVGAAMALGLVAATYPWVDGWYDLARGDTLFLSLVVAGIVALGAWARRDTGWRGHARVGAAAAILALAFFCKQTGVLYVAAGGAMLAVLNARRLPVYVMVAGVIGLGGTALFDAVSDGWFWTYTFEVHQAHDCNQARFVKSFALILGRFPAMTAVIAAGVLAVGVSWAVTRRRPPACGVFLAALWLFAVSCVVGALGWATQWAHYNAYIPAMFAGGVAAGAALPAIASALPAIPRAPAWLGGVAAFVAAAALAVQLVTAWWQPRQFVPTDADRAAGDRLIELIAAIDGEVLLPFHPWYAHLAGKPVHVHRMGVMDVSYVPARSQPAAQKCFWARGERDWAPPPPWQIRELRDWIEHARFAVIIWNDRHKAYFPPLSRAYRLDDFVPANARPRTYSGADTVPHEIWVPAAPALPPAGAEVLWSFESGRFGDQWRLEGTAWGRRPVTGPLPEQGAVRGYRGRFYASSMHGGDRTTGTVFSPDFTITGSRLTLRVSGGSDAERLRVELHVEGELVDYVTPSQSSERMEERAFGVAHHKGKRARLVLIDKATGSWGHLNVDEVWQWE